MSAILVSEGTAKAVDFSTLGGGNFRQVVAIGDPTTDANYALVGASGLNVTGTFIANGGTISAISSGTITSNLYVAGAPVSTANPVSVQPPASGALNVTFSAGTITTINNVSAGTVNAKLYTGNTFIGQVAASPETSIVYNATAVLIPQFTAIAISPLGNNTLLNGVSSLKIRVLALSAINGTATNMYLTDAANGTAIFANSSNPAQLSANSGFILPFNQVGWFQTSPGNALVMNLSASSSVGGSLTYITV